MNYIFVSRGLNLPIRCFGRVIPAPRYIQTTLAKTSLAQVHCGAVQTVITCLCKILISVHIRIPSTAAPPSKTQKLPKTKTVSVHPETKHFMQNLITLLTQVKSHLEVKSHPPVWQNLEIHIDPARMDITSQCVSGLHVSDLRYLLLYVLCVFCCELKQRPHFNLGQAVTHVHF